MYDGEIVISTLWLACIVYGDGIPGNKWVVDGRRGR